MASTSSGSKPDEEKHAVEENLFERIDKYVDEMAGGAVAVGVGEEERLRTWRERPEGPVLDADGVMSPAERAEVESDIESVRRGDAGRGDARRGGDRAGGGGRRRRRRENRKPSAARAVAALPRDDAGWNSQARSSGASSMASAASSAPSAGPRSGRPERESGGTRGGRARLVTPRTRHRKCNKRPTLRNTTRDTRKGTGAT